MKKQLLLIAAFALSSMIELNAIGLGPNETLIQDEAQFARVLAGSPRLVLLMYSNDCQACVMPKVNLGQIAAEMPGVIFAYVNAKNEALLNVVQRYRSQDPHLINGLPTIKVFRNGNEMGEVTTPATKVGLKNQISEHLGLIGQAHAAPAH